MTRRRTWTTADTIAVVFLGAIAAFMLLAPILMWRR